MRAPIALLFICLAGLAAGCGSGSRDAMSAAQKALVATTPAPPTTTSTPGKPCPAVTSTAPLTPMPQPGHMPAGTTMYRITHRRPSKLIVGVDQNTLLFAAWNPVHERLEGFEIDVAGAIAQAMFGPNYAQHLDFDALTTGQRIGAVQNGQVDLAVDAVTITCERLQQVLFSRVYYDAGQKVLVPLDSTAQGIEDLAGRRVCATSGSTTIANLKPYGVVPVGVPQRTDCLVLLQEGKVDAVSADDSILFGLAKQDPYTKIIGRRSDGKSFSREPYGIAINDRDPDFVAFVNGVLARMEQDGTWARLYAKWICPSAQGIATCPPRPPAATVLPAP
jgi:polar amino acid transport system substrate-binding protein